MGRPQTFKTQLPSTAHKVITYLMETQYTSNCKNCQSSLQGPFCGQCGQEVRSRITLKAIILDFWASLINLEKGFWFTIKELLVAPGRVVIDYTKGRTIPYMNPLRFTLLLAGISVLLNLWLGIFEEQQSEISSLFTPSGSEEQIQAYRENQERFSRAVRPYLNVIPLILIPFTAFFFWLFTRRGSGLNYAENLVAGCFAQGQMAFIGLFVTLTYFLHHNANLLFYLGLLNFIAYYTYLYKRLTNHAWSKITAIAFAAFSLGYLSLILLVMVITVLVLFVMQFLGLLQ